MADVAELERVLGHIKANPERHHQGWWICGTTACFAGHTVLLHGWQRADSVWTYLVSHPVSGRETVVSEVATEILDLTDRQANELFIRARTLEDVERVVKEIANGEL